MAYAEPDYQVLATYDQVEVRRYAPYVVAETTVEGSFNQARQQAFRRLFNFISGYNGQREPIAMTVPVNQAPSKGEKIAMTVPVFSSPDTIETADRWTMEFVMPPGASLEALPLPKDAAVRMREVPERVVAVHRYSGSTGEQRYRERAAFLERSLAQMGIEQRGSPVQAVYNGPFTIGPLRRNEVVVEVAYTEK